MRRTEEVCCFLLPGVGPECMLGWGCLMLLVHQQWMAQLRRRHSRHSTSTLPRSMGYGVSVWWWRALVSASTRLAQLGITMVTQWCRHALKASTSHSVFYLLSMEDFAVGVTSGNGRGAGWQVLSGKCGLGSVTTLLMGVKCVTS